MQGRSKLELQLTAIVFEEVPTMLARRDQVGSLTKYAVKPKRREAQPPKTKFHLRARTWITERTEVVEHVQSSLYT